MNRELKLRRPHLTALVGAFAVGALTAALASGAGPEPKLITLKDGPERLVIAQGSDGGDSVRVYGTLGDITFAADRQFTVGRTDCAVTGPAETNAVCTDTDLETIDAGLGTGSDRFDAREGFLATGVELRVRGGRGEDRLTGSDLGDELEGGDGDDRLKGLRGRDELDGGQQDDHCDGGPGKDNVKNCE